MIKSVSFKNPGTVSMQVAGRLIQKDELTPALYMQLVRVDPRFSEQFNVVMEDETNVKPTQDGKTTNARRKTGSLEASDSGATGDL